MATPWSDRTFIHPTLILLAALIFGAGHLPAAAALLPITPLFLARTLVLNGLVGTVCGWLFWRRGLEAAMIAHLSADLVLHVAVPLSSLGHAPAG
ncbi:MAG TPA: CPBP family glutamic-type intramembrane protease [Pseudomonadota bacterium]|nr:CPBP family glutamic-type intramembrane protease [Pseudomonadota bacterium]